MSLRGISLALATSILVLAATALPASAKNGGGGVSGGTRAVDCRLPESNAEALVILSNHYPGYWWDHTHLTIAVQA